MTLTTFFQHVHEMTAVVVKNVLNLLWSRFLIIRQNVNMATNAILYSGLTPIVGKVRLQTAFPVIDRNGGEQRK